MLLMMYVTPVGFLIGGLGKLFGATDVLFLFKISILIEFLLFVAGMVKLSLLLFEKYESVLLVGIGSILSFSWIASVDANFHIFYMFPFIFRYMTLFLTTGTVRYLGIAGVFCVFSCFGNVPYHPPVLVLLITLYSVAMIAQGSLRGKRLVFSSWDLVPFLIVFAGAATHIGTYLLNFDGLQSYSLGRDPVTRVVTKESYLTYGGVSKIYMLAKEYLLGFHTQGDNTFYLGLAPFLFIAAAFVRCRRKECLALAFIAAFLLSFSFGGFTAAITYYFPGMSLYRHVGLIFGQARVFLLLVAGFGLNALLLNASAAGTQTDSSGWTSLFSPKRSDGFLRLLMIVMFMAEGAYSFFNPTSAWTYLLFPTPSAKYDPIWYAIPRALWYLGCLVATWWSVRSRALQGPSRTAFVMNMLLLAFVVDIASFKAKALIDWPAASEKDIDCSQRLFRPREMTFINQRLPPAEIWKNNDLLRFYVARAGCNQAAYVHAWEVVGIDPFEPGYRTDFLSSYVADLFRQRSVAFELYPPISMVPESDLWLKRAIGHKYPKLRLIPSDGLDSNFNEPEPPAATSPDGLGEISNIELTANWLKARVHVVAGSPVRLYYADAFHPGWSATVDGRVTTVDRTNVAFKSIVLEPGEHNVEFRFFNRWGSVCLYILAISSVGLVCYSVFELVHCADVRLPGEHS